MAVYDKGRRSEFPGIPMIRLHSSFTGLGRVNLWLCPFFNCFIALSLGGALNPRLATSHLR
jgi:hypothetical protein